MGTHGFLDSFMAWGAEATGNSYYMGNPEAIAFVDESIDFEQPEPNLAAFDRIMGL